MAKLNKHNPEHRELFDEDTAQVGALGDIIEAHAGDAVFILKDDRGVPGADAGESDFEAEMLSDDPAAELELDPDDLYVDNEQIWGTDQTGTVEGIARGFGTHMPQDLGRRGFHVEEIPDVALQYRGRVLHEGEELDDYDDKVGGDTFDQDPLLARASEPGANRVKPDQSEAMPDRMPVRKPRPRDADDEFDATREIR